MRKKQFKAESKKLLDMMINSIYTHKEIFLRELISNASDAIDKRYYRSLSDGAAGLLRDEYTIQILIDKDKRELVITDNGCGMTLDELENNLGTIAKSGSLDFKKDVDKKEDVEIIGQFGVGFYSSFMVSDLVTVETKAISDDKGYRWVSSGADGYTIEECEKEEVGTKITLHIKENTEDENYDTYLEQYKIRELVTRYSDYIRYPIMMDMESRELKEGSENEYETVIKPTQLNSMVPIWRKNKNELTQEDYDNFYREKFYDFEEPLLTVHSKTEGQATYDALLFVPKRAPYNYYSKDFEPGLQLYSNGVLIMDKCADLLPDYFSFVRGLVDSADLSLNISREMLQHDRQLKIIAKNIEKKIKSELKKLLVNNREKYEEFWKTFGVQIKFGVYNNYGINKEVLTDLLMFVSSNENKLVTLEEYKSRMSEEQKDIYYACGETVEKIEMLPQTDAVKDKGFEILYLTDNVDEFALKILMDYEGKGFINICADNMELGDEAEKESVKKENEDSKDLLQFMKESLGDSVQKVRFTNKLKNHPVCLTSEGALSVEMEKVLNAMPTDEKVKAEIVLEVNAQHKIADKLKSLYGNNNDEVAKYTKILYYAARLISGMSVDNPTELSTLICELMV